MLLAPCQCVDRHPVLPLAVTRLPLAFRPEGPPHHPTHSLPPPRPTPPPPPLEPRNPSGPAEAPPPCGRYLLAKARPQPLHYGALPRRALGSASRWTGRLRLSCSSDRKPLPGAGASGRAGRRPRWPPPHRSARRSASPYRSRRSASDQARSGRLPLLLL